MQRRDFGKALIGGAVGAALGGLTDSAPAFGQPQKKLTPRRNTKMHVGADYHVIEGSTLTGKENLEYNLRFGVKSISPDPDQEAHRGKAAHFDAFIPAEGPLGGAFDADVLKQMKDDCDAVGMWLEALRTTPVTSFSKTPPIRTGSSIRSATTSAKLRRSMFISSATTGP